MCKPLGSCYCHFYLPKRETDHLPWWVPTREPKREVLPQPLTLLRLHICDQEPRDYLITIPISVAVWDLLVSPNWELPSSTPSAYRPEDLVQINSCNGQEQSQSQSLHIDRFVLDWMVKQGRSLFSQASKFVAALGNNFIKEVNFLQIFNIANQASTREMIVLLGLLTY